MSIQKLTPILWTKDLEKSIDFYINVLSFSLENRERNWAILKNKNIEVMLSTSPQKNIKEKIGFSGSFYFLTDNVEEVWINLKESENVVYPLEYFEWGMMEFAITDPNGYILQFGQSV